MKDCQNCQNGQECLNCQKWQRLKIAKIAPSASIVYHFWQCFIEPFPYSANDNDTNNKMKTDCGDNNDNKND